jgi:hypothetical protein
MEKSLPFLILFIFGLTAQEFIWPQKWGDNMRTSRSNVNKVPLLCGPAVSSSLYGMDLPSGAYDLDDQAIVGDDVVYTIYNQQYVNATKISTY